MSADTRLTAVLLLATWGTPLGLGLVYVIAQVVEKVT